MYTPNPITAFDFYKADHRRQYPEGTDMVYSNFTPRSARLANTLGSVWDGKVVFCGLQAFLQEFLVKQFNEQFFNKPLEEVIFKFERRMNTSLGPNDIGSEHIKALHNLGYLPIKIKALKEGSKVNIKVPVFTIKNTLPEFFWLTNALETVLSMFVWKPTTSATVAHQYKKLLNDYAEKTGTDKEFVWFQAHDFSMRGMSGFDDAVMSGFGHILSFTGSDTIPAIDFAEQYYFADAAKDFIAGSVPATEHSVMCMGTKDGELETYRRLIEDVYPSGLVSIVSDTWDFWYVLTHTLPSLRDSIMARDGKVVIRPDSGDPVKILTGYLVEEIEAVVFKEPNVDGELEYVTKFRVVDTGEFITEAEFKGAVQILWETFGGTITEKGYKMLDSHIGLIYGDSITLERAQKIMERLERKGYASGNVVLGVGSFTYEYATRDTYGFAMKATAGSVNGELREIFKDPATDTGVKKSAKGLLRVEKQGDDFVLYDQQSPEQEEGGELIVVFENGNLSNQQSLAEIRSLLNN